MILLSIIFSHIQISLVINKRQCKRVPVFNAKSSQFLISPSSLFFQQFKKTESRQLKNQLVNIFHYQGFYWALDVIFMVLDWFFTFKNNEDFHEIPHCDFLMWNLKIDWLKCFLQSRFYRNAKYNTISKYISP